MFNKKIFHFLFSLIIAVIYIACDDSNNTTSNNSDLNSNTNNSTDTNNGTDTNNATDTNNSTSIGCSAPPRQFWNWDLTQMPPADVQIPATCRAEGTHSYIYVSDEAWENGMVNQEIVNNVLHAWENGTARNPDLGIYEHTTSVFGNPPDVDNDPHIIIFITPLGSYHGSTFDGYFKSENELSGEHSNQTEMVYIDCENHQPDSEYLLGVLAHEFQHMLQWQADRDELSWLNETLSQASMYLNGYWGDLQLGEQYLKNTAQNKLELTANDQPYDYNYGAGFLFAAYAVDRFGEDFFRTLAADEDNGSTSVNNVLITMQYDGDFYDLLLDWAVANLINDPAIENGIYSYAQLTLNSSPTIRVAELGITYSPSIVLGGYYYIKAENVAGGQSLEIAVSHSSQLRAKAIIQETNGTTTIQNLDISQGIATVTPNSNADITFIVLRAGGNAPQIDITLNEVDGNTK